MNENFLVEILVIKTKVWFVTMGLDDPKARMNQALQKFESLRTQKDSNSINIAT